MRITIIAAVVSLVTMTAKAQAPEQQDVLPDGVLTVEWRLNPFDYESKPTNMAQLHGRFFLNGIQAVRFGVGVGMNHDNDESSKSLDTKSLDANNYSMTNSTTTVKGDELSLKVSLGYEHHYAFTGRLDFYAGAEVGYQGRFFSGTKDVNRENTTVQTTDGVATTTVINTYEKYDYQKRSGDGSKLNEHGLFGTLFTGVDFYVYRKLYVGVEFGLTYHMGKKVNSTYTYATGMTKQVGDTKLVDWTSTYYSANGVTAYVDHLNGNNNEDTKNDINETKGNYSRLYLEPAIRIGWMF